MIRFIAAIDEKRGLADDNNIPWLGKIPTDIRRFHEKTEHSVVLMGYGTYVKFSHPLSDRRNFVASTKSEQLREGYELVTDARQFLQNAQEDIWVIGGGELFKSTLDLADELELTHLSGDFKCTKFFPEFEDKFELVKKSEPITENNISYYFATYRKKSA